MLPSFIKVPNTSLKLARRLGLGDLRRHKKDGHVSGLGHMIACLIYSVPTNSQVTKVRLLVLTAILLAPEGSGLFMYIFLWLIIPVESDKEHTERNAKRSKPSSTRRSWIYKDAKKKARKWMPDTKPREIIGHGRDYQNQKKEKWWTEVVNR
jgi:hypothetical protein